MAPHIVAESVFTSSLSDYTDDCSMVTLHVDGHTFAVQKALLMDASPVFNAMFSHDTREAASNHVEVKDFNANTVVAIVACLNGHLPTSATAEEIIEMLWLADKYFMEAVTFELEAVLIKLVSVDTLFGITRYASAQSRTRLMARCVHVYCAADEVVFTPEDFDVKKALIQGMFATRL
uniref:BTB domain-containing protein n=1 Tax=Panagrellus redivivus TaxID=6233 RepID=A0A7E4UYE5_PANRE